MSGDSILGSIVALFLLACIITGTYTMIVYAYAFVTHWHGIVCG